MRTYLSLTMIFAFVVSVGPALADERFHAFSQLPVEQQAALTPLADDQLAGIEGGNVIIAIPQIEGLLRNVLGLGERLGDISVIRAQGFGGDYYIIAGDDADKRAGGAGILAFGGVFNSH